jgi:hypothetical protein
MDGLVRQMYISLQFKSSEHTRLPLADTPTLAWTDQRETGPTPSPPVNSNLWNDLHF